MNPCFHDVQHHLIIIIDGLKSRKANIFANQIENIDFWVWTQGSISDLVWAWLWTSEKLRRSRKDEKGEADRERRGGDTKKREEESEGEIGRRGGGTEEEAEEQVDRGGGEGEEETEEMQATYIHICGLNSAFRIDVSKQKTVIQ